MNPTTICSGFRKCGIYPFNPDAIDCSVSVDNPEASLQPVNRTPNDNGEGEQIIEALLSISPEKLLLYQRRLEEGYDLPDQEYMEWLSANHSETFADKFSGNDGIGSVALSDLFGDVPVASPVAELVSDCTAANKTKISADNTGNELFDDMGIDLVQGDPSRTWLSR